LCGGIACAAALQATTYISISQETCENKESQPAKLTLTLYCVNILKSNEGTAGTYLFFIPFFGRDKKWRTMPMKCALRAQTWRAIILWVMVFQRKAMPIKTVFRKWAWRDHRFSEKGRLIWRAVPRMP
jgi:hypothetical protein